MEQELQERVHAPAATRPYGSNLRTSQAFSKPGDHGGSPYPRSRFAHLVAGHSAEKMRCVSQSELRRHLTHVTTVVTYAPCGQVADLLWQCMCWPFSRIEKARK